MPKYELMYILSSAVSDNDVPTIATEVQQYITSEGGTLLAQEMMGKKKLAYPIKKTRNGFYVLETFNLDGAKMQGLDNKLRSIDSIIRYLIANLDDLEVRKAKDKTIQDKMKGMRKLPVEKPEEIKPAPEINLTETELEQKIEKALESEDLAK